jgi:alkaline phosphatase
MIRLNLLGWLTLALLAAAPVAAQDAAPPLRVILFIGDGTGIGQWSGAVFAADRLAVAEFPVVGLVDTRASNSDVTDSAASATAYATGERTYNGAIGVRPDFTTAPTVLERATELGMATGLVATSRITHATPAAFAAHVPRRYMELEIARQMVEEHDINVIIGGGRDRFDGARRPDSLDLLGEACARATCVDSPAALDSLDVEHVTRLFALIAEAHLLAAVRADTTAANPHGVEQPDTTWVRWRTLSLATMTRTALTVLDHDPDGFFLMVEASQPDWRSHESAPLPAVVAEVLDLDGAVREALAYQERHPETLIVITGDHETGGMALQLDEGGELAAAYTTSGHTALLVPLFAKGPGAERFGGILSNAVVGQRLWEVVEGR